MILNAAVGYAKLYRQLFASDFGFLLNESNDFLVSFLGSLLVSFLIMAD